MGFRVQVFQVIFQSFRVEGLGSGGRVAAVCAEKLAAKTMKHRQKAHDFLAVYDRFRTKNYAQANLGSRSTGSQVNFCDGPVVVVRAVPVHVLQPVVRCATRGLRFRVQFSI